MATSLLNLYKCFNISDPPENLRRFFDTAVKFQFNILAIFKLSRRNEEDKDRVTIIQVNHWRHCCDDSIREFNQLCNTFVYGVNDPSDTAGVFLGKNAEVLYVEPALCDYSEPGSVEDVIRRICSERVVSAFQNHRIF